MASMSTRRLGVAVAVLGGFLYAVGGSDGTSPLNTGTVLSHVKSTILNSPEGSWISCVPLHQ